ncbi:MAG: crossover junction endodeoxyribonuclease RuvC [Ignavibacterium sp.]|nr:crossover junction endodeoxyribonuclease RuvC [Ignavibacterium sp.]
MKVLSVDGALSHTGYAVWDREKVTKIGIIQTKECKATPYSSDRIFYICNEIDKIIKEENIDVVVVENQFTGVNRKTSSILSNVRGAIQYIVKMNQKEIYACQPTVIKKVISQKGNSKKEDMFKAIEEKQREEKIIDEQMWNKIIELKEKNKKIDDIIDAISIGYVFHKYRKKTSPI